VGSLLKLRPKRGLRLKVEDLSVFFEIVSRSLLEENTGFMLEMLSGGDIRRGLSLVREFLASAHTSADFALASYLTDGQYHFPQHERSSGAQFSDSISITGRESLIRIFSIPSLMLPTLQLLRLHITHWFIAKAQFGIFEGAQLTYCSKSLTEWELQKLM
jgi:hypothetical protein